MMTVYMEHVVGTANVSTGTAAATIVYGTVVLDGGAENAADEDGGGGKSSE